MRNFKKKNPNSIYNRNHRVCFNLDMSCLQYFELYSISSVQCGSNLNKVLRNAATPAVNYGFKTFMKLHFNPQMPTISQDIFHSFEKLKAFSKILSNRSIIRIKMRIQNRYGLFFGSAHCSALTQKISAHH